VLLSEDGRVVTLRLRHLRTCKMPILIFTCVKFMFYGEKIGKRTLKYSPLLIFFIRALIVGLYSAAL